MQTRDIIEVVSAVVGGIGFLSAILGYIFITYTKSGKEKTDGVVSSSEQLVKFWKDQVEGFKAIVESQNLKMENQRNDFTKQVKDLSNQLAELTGRLMAAEKQAKDYLAVLQNRNPELEKVLEKIVQYLEKLSISSDHSNKVLDQQVKNEAGIAERDKNLVSGRTS